MMNKVPSYHKWTRQTYGSLLQPCTTALCYVPPCLEVKPSPMLSSGLLFALVQQCPLMKSLDLWTSAVGRSEISLVISREQEMSMSQSMNNQPFTNHFKMRTFRYYFMLNCLATLIYAMKHLFNTLSSTPDLYLNELQLELQERHGVSVSISTIWRTLKRGGYSMKKVCNISSWWQVQH